MLPVVSSHRGPRLMQDGKRNRTTPAERVGDLLRDLERLVWFRPRRHYELEREPETNALCRL